MYMWVGDLLFYMHRYCYAYECAAGRPPAETAETGSIKRRGTKDCSYFFSNIWFVDRWLGSDVSFLTSTMCSWSTGLARVAVAPAAGAAKLSLRLATILNEHDVTELTQAMLGDAGYDTTSR